MGEAGHLARSIARGDIWTYEFAPPDKRRPVLVLTRNSAIPYLHSVMVAPVTSTIRGIRSEVIVGEEEGLKHASAVNLDNVQTVSKRSLRRHIGRLDTKKMSAVCHALAVATGCA